MKNREWAEQFKANPDCKTCPFVIDEVDNGVGIQYHCDKVCKKEVSDIVKEMYHYCKGDPW